MYRPAWTKDVNNIMYKSDGKQVPKSNWANWEFKPTDDTEYCVYAKLRDGKTTWKLISRYSTYKFICEI